MTDWTDLLAAPAASGAAGTGSGGLLGLLTGNDPQAKLAMSLLQSAPSVPFGKAPAQGFGGSAPNVPPLQQQIPMNLNPSALAMLQQHLGVPAFGQPQGQGQGQGQPQLPPQLAQLLMAKGLA